MKRRGFTLIELLVVISIIAILSAVGLSTFTGAQKKARDARRRADIKAIQNALEQNYIVNNTYATNYTALTAYFSGGVVPDDPTATQDYSYTAGPSATAYTVCATLESPVSTFCASQLQ